MRFLQIDMRIDIDMRGLMVTFLLFPFCFQKNYTPAIILQIALPLRIVLLVRSLQPLLTSWDHGDETTLSTSDFDSFLQSLSAALQQRSGQSSLLPRDSTTVTGLQAAPVTPATTCLTPRQRHQK